MPSLTDYTSYADAVAHFSRDALWALFDGDREHLNIAHECVDRHATSPERVAVRIVHADGGDETLTFDDLARWSARFANHLEAAGVERGDLHPGHEGTVNVRLVDYHRRPHRPHQGAPPCGPTAESSTSSTSSIP